MSVRRHYTKVVPTWPYTIYGTVYAIYVQPYRLYCIVVLFSTEYSNCSAVLAYIIYNANISTCKHATVLTMLKITNRVCNRPFFWIPGSWTWRCANRALLMIYRLHGLVSLPKLCVKGACEILCDPFKGIFPGLLMRTTHLKKCFTSNYSSESIVGVV